MTVETSERSAGTTGAGIAEPEAKPTPTPAPTPTGRRGWRLDREISLGHLIMTAALLISAFSWAGSIEAKLAAMEARETAMQSRLDRFEASQAVRLERIERTLARIEAALARRDVATEEPGRQP